MPLDPSDQLKSAFLDHHGYRGYPKNLSVRNYNSKKINTGVRI